MRPKADAVVAVPGSSGTFGRAWLGVIKPKLQPTHLQAVAHQQPQGRVLQLGAQRLENLVARIAAIVVAELLQGLGLRGGQKSPKLVFGNAVFGVRDVGLFKHTMAVNTGQVGRHMGLKAQLGWLFLAHVKAAAVAIAAATAQVAPARHGTAGILGGWHPSRFQAPPGCPSAVFRNAETNPEFAWTAP